jgi:Zn-dependent peptidase ImmA (M78 family)
MNNRVYERLDALIARTQLHRSRIPVDMDRLKEEFPVDYRDLQGTDVLGFLLTLPTPIIVIDQSLDAYDARLIHAHEIGHALYGHRGTLRSLSVDKWFDSKAERQAWQVAAHLLIPERVFYEYRGWTVEDIAGLCGVPDWLMAMYLGRVGM